MDDEFAQQQARVPRKSRSILVWLALGLLVGVLLTVVFFAYGQPELLLDQLNLRYCG